MPAPFSFSPAVDDPQAGPIDYRQFMQARPWGGWNPSGAQQWQSAIAANAQRQAQAPSMGQQILDIAGNTGSMLAAPLMAGPRLMRDVASGAIDPNSPEAIRRSVDVALNTVGMGMLGAERGAIGALGGRGFPAPTVGGKSVGMEAPKGGSHVVAKLTDSGKPVILGVHSTPEAAAAHRESLLKSDWDRFQKENYDPEYMEPYPGEKGYMDAQRTASGEILYPHQIPQVIPAEGRGNHVVASGSLDPRGGAGEEVKIHGIFDNPDAAKAAADKVAREHWAEHGETEEFPKAWDDAFRKHGYDPDEVSFVDRAQGREWYRLENDGTPTPVHVPSDVEAHMKSLEDMVVPYPGFAKAAKYWRDIDEDHLIPIVKKVGE